jgi:predicted transcriptional regulator
MAKVLISMRVDEDLLKLIDSVAEKEGVTRTDVMEFALRNGVKSEQEFVEALEKPLQRMLLQAATSKPFIDVISLLVGKQPNKRRVSLAHEGLAKQRPDKLKAKEAKT